MTLISHHEVVISMADDILLCVREVGSPAQAWDEDRFVVLEDEDEDL